MLRTPRTTTARNGARTSLQLLVDRTFGPWFWGNAVSNSGKWMFNVAAAIVVFEATGSALLVGMVSAAQFLPLVILGPFAGSVTDRVDRRRLLLASQVVAALASGAVGVLGLLTGLDRYPGAWPVILAAGGIGLAQAVGSPTLNALVPALVPDEDLESAVSLNALTFSIGRAFGPALAGVFIISFGAAVAFLANALSFVAFILALVMIRPRTRDHHGRGDRSLRAGLAYVRTQRRILLILLGVAGIGFATDPLITLAPALAAEISGSSAAASSLVSAFGVTAIPAAAASGAAQRRWGSPTVAGIGAALIAVGLTLTAIAPVLTIAVAGFGIGGVGFVLALTGFTSHLHRHTPDEYRGRVMALWSVAFLGVRPLAATLDGALADIAGPRIALSLAISTSLVAAGVAMVLRRLHLRPKPPPPDGTANAAGKVSAQRPSPPATDRGHRSVQDGS